MDQVTKKFLNNPYVFCREYGDNPFYVELFGVPTLMVSDMNLAQTVLIDCAETLSGKAGNRTVASTLFGSSVLYEDGNAHQNLRLNLDPLFRPVRSEARDFARKYTKIVADEHCKNESFSSLLFFKKITILLTAKYYFNINIPLSDTEKLSDWINDLGVGLFATEANINNDNLFKSAFESREKLNAYILSQFKVEIESSRILSSLTTSVALDQIVTLLFAGVDTMSSTLSFALGNYFILCKSPRENKRQKIKIAIEQSLNEIPSVYFIPRGAVKNINIGKYEVKEGWNVNVMVSELHRKRLINNDDGCFCPFGMGKKKCPGQAFSLIVMYEILDVLSAFYHMDALDGDLSQRGFVPGQHPLLPIILNFRRKEGTEDA